MPISTKTKTSLLTPEMKQQIASNGKIESEEEIKVTVSNEGNSSPKIDVSTIEPNISESKSKYNDVANLHFSKGKKAEFKSFFSSHEVTLVQGVENAVSYIMKEVKAGRLKVSRNGIEKVGE